MDWREFLGWEEDQLKDLRFAGFAYIRQGKYDVALPFFEALLVLDPKSAYDIQTLGALYLQMGDASRALKFLESSLDLDSKHIPTILNRSKALLLLGKREQGLRIARKLSDHSDEFISNSAKALVLAYN